MPKVTLTDITSGHGSSDLINANNTAIENAFDNTLSLDGTSPNQMQANLDMNGYAILNFGAVATDISWNWRGVWTTATAYAIADVVYVQLSDDATNGGRTYYCNTAHTSGTFSSDIGNWTLVAERGATGATGAGTGDVLASNNLSDLDNLTTALNNLITAHGPLATTDIADDAITLAKLASGTDGELITWDASGDPATVAVGTSGHVLTSNGAGAAPTFQALPSATAASQAEMEAGTSTTVYVSPGRQQYHPGMAKAWGVVASGGTLGANYNVASVARPGTGQYTITFTTAMSSGSYAVAITPQGSISAPYIAFVNSTGKSTTGFQVRTYEITPSPGAVNAAFSFVVYGDQ